MTSELKGHGHFRLILVSTRNGLRCYASRDTMPPEVREQFERAMAGPDCNTLVLASEEAAAVVARQVARQGGELARGGSGIDLRLAVDLVLLGVLGLALWCLATLR